MKRMGDFIVIFDGPIENNSFNALVSVAMAMYVILHFQ